MNYQQLIKALFILCVMCLSFTSCSTDDSKLNTDTTSITVKLKSTLGELDKVFLDVVDVQIRVSASEQESGEWLSLNAINLGVCDTSTISQETQLLLVDNFDLNTDYFHEIRLVLGENNFMNIGNVLHALDVNNATPSNLIKTRLSSNGRYDVVIDIDIDESVSYDDEENMMVLTPKIYTAIRQFEY